MATSTQASWLIRILALLVVTHTEGMAHLHTLLQLSVLTMTFRIYSTDFRDHV